MFFSVVIMMFFAFLLVMPAETLQIVFSTQRLVWSRDFPCWRWKTHYSAMLLVIVKFEGTQPLYANNFTWWQPPPVFFYHVNLLFSSTIAHVNALERFLEIKNYGTPGFEPGFSRTSAKRSTTELFPLEYRKSTKHCLYAYTYNW